MLQVPTVITQQAESRSVSICHQAVSNKAAITIVITQQTESRSVKICHQAINSKGRKY